MTSCLPVTAHQFIFFFFASIHYIDKIGKDLISFLFWQLIKLVNNLTISFRKLVFIFFRIYYLFKKERKKICAVQFKEFKILLVTSEIWNFSYIFIIKMYTSEIGLTKPLYSIRHKITITKPFKSGLDCIPRVQ